MKRGLSKLLIVGLLSCMLIGCGNEQEANHNTEQTTTAENTNTELTSTLTDETTELPHEHSYTESTTKEATCTEAGEKTFTCDCGDTYTEQIEATGHIYEEYVANNDATYTSDGTESATCVCGLTDTRTAAGSKLEYTYTELNTIMYATASANLRDLPGLEGNVVGKVNEGDQVSVLSKCNETNWYRIQYNDLQVFVSNDYLSDEKPEPTYDLGDGVKRKYGVLYVNTCGKHLTNEPTLCESLGPFPYPLHTLIDNGDGTFTVYAVNNHGGFYDGQWTLAFETKTGYYSDLENQGYTVQYVGGSDYTACVGGYDEGCIHKWIVYK